MRGRDIFRKYRGLLNFLVSFFNLFQRKTREKLFESFRRKKGYVGFAIRYALIKSLAKSVGENVAIFPDVYFFNLQNLSIGDNVSIHPLCYIDANGGIVIGNDVSIAHDTSIISFNHKYDNMSVPIRDQGLEKCQITIKDNVWIGAKSVLLAGVTVNSGSVIGAASVVTHDVGENIIVAGSPARIIKNRGNE